MPEKVKRKPQAIEHLKRYGITTDAVLAKLYYSGGKEAARTRTRELRNDDKHITSHPLRPSPSKEQYHIFSEQGADAAGVARSWANPKKGSDLRHYYGTLLFCCFDDVVRPKLTLDEFTAAFPDLLEESELQNRIHSHAYYLDIEHGKDKRLGRIVVASSNKHAVSLYDQALDGARESMNVVVNENRFALAVAISGDAKKAKAYQRQLFKRQSENPGIAHITVRAYPQLDGL